MIPKVIQNALRGLPIPIYGSGRNIRDWIYVKDHCKGIYLALALGKVGDTYLFGGDKELRNIDLVEQICLILDDFHPSPDGRSYKEQVEFIVDRKGHDWRYAIDSNKAKQELGFEGPSNFRQNLLKTVKSYLLEWSADEKTTSRVTRKHLQHEILELDYSGFQSRALNKHLSEYERIGFNDEDRTGLTPQIFSDIRKKLNLDQLVDGVMIDIGCGAGSLTNEIVSWCSQQKIEVYLNDSPEMLAHNDHISHYVALPGKFPEVFSEVLAAQPEGFDAVLCYSVIHYVPNREQIVDFILKIFDLLKPNGKALIGDIPNASQRARFFASPTGKALNRSYWASKGLEERPANRSKHSFIDDNLLQSLVLEVRNAGGEAFIVPQPSTLPMHNRRCDLLIQRN